MTSQSCSKTWLKLSNGNRIAYINIHVTQRRAGIEQAMLDALIIGQLYNNKTPIRVSHYKRLNDSSECGPMHPLGCGLNQGRTFLATIRNSFYFWLLTQDISVLLIRWIALYSSYFSNFCLIIYGRLYWFASASLANPYCQSTWMCVCWFASASLANP